MSLSNASLSRLPAWAQVSSKRYGHIERVAELLAEWADALDLDAAERERWLRAAYLHDALKDAPIEHQVALAEGAFDRPKLLHGPAAARVAEEHGEHDRGVLDAVWYHSVGYAQWDQVGRMLYLADYLEPGRRFWQSERAALVAQVPAEPDATLLRVARKRIQMSLKSGWPLLTETVEFWNSLV